MVIQEININRIQEKHRINREELETSIPEMCKFCTGYSLPRELVIVHLLNEDSGNYEHEYIHEVCGLLAIEEGIHVYSECNCGDEDEPWV